MPRARPALGMLRAPGIVGALGMLRVLGLVGALGLALACDRSAGRASGASADGTPAVPQRTTRGDLALRNLSDRIDTLGRRAARSPLNLAQREQWVDALLTRTQFTGSFPDLARVLEIAESAVRDFDQDPKAYLLRARAASGVHRFEDAVKDLETAARLGADIAARLASIRIAQGRDLEAAREFARARVERSASLEHLGLLANAEAALGEFDAADRHYAAALATLRDVSPFPVAQLCFQRGVMWAERAQRPERALPYYVEAVRRVPAYVVANVHLAELEADLGRRDDAIQRLRAIVDHTEDPEPVGYLGELLLAQDPTDRSAPALIARARAGYERLLQEHRSAFLDHAAEFFAGPGGDPPLASSLAQENLALRQTPRAHALAIEASLGAHDTALACRLIDAARPAAARDANLRALLERESARCATR